MSQWDKVEALARRGFFFLPASEPYPDTLREVPDFASRQAAHVAEWRARFPDYYLEVGAALAG